MRLGKVIGGALGALLGGPVGAAVGIGAGHRMDLRARQRPDLLHALFTLMGHISALDGRVSEGEVAYGEALIVRLGLSRSEHHAAVQAFNSGRSADFLIGQALRNLADTVDSRSMAALDVLDVLIGIAWTDRKMVPAKQAVLQRAGEALGIGIDQVRGRIKLLQPRGAGLDAGAARRLLGVTDSADVDTCKQAWRRKVAVTHPDRLRGAGASEADIAAADDLSRALNSAWAAIKASKS